ncbi:MAG TPA: LysM domain-containing protein, partial [Longimicrobium sp.]|nr:LysM domain-containing protein [Longimicrobium sp.]
MSLETLQRDLEHAASSGSLPLTAALAPGLGGIVAALGAETFTITWAAVTRPAAVVVTGKAAFRGSEWDAVLEGREGAAGEGFYRFTLTLRLRGTGTWTLGTAFTDLPYGERYLEGVLAAAPSMLSGVAVRDPVFTARNGGAAEGTLRLAGTVAMEGPLADYAGWLGAGPFPLDGTVQVRREGPPLLDLRATVPGWTVRVGTAALEGFGLRLGVGWTPGSVAERRLVSRVDLVASVAVGATDPLRVTLAAPLFQGDFVWALRAEIDDYTEQLRGGLRALAGLFGAGAELALPPGIDAATRFYLSEVAVVLRPAASGAIPSLAAVTATVRSRARWAPPVPYVAVRDVAVRWTLAFSGGAPEWNAVAFGTVELGTPPENGVRGDVSVAFPDFEIAGELDPETPIPLGRMFSWFLGAPSRDDTGLRVTSFGFLANPVTQEFRAQAHLLTPWALRIGDAVFRLAWIDAYVSSTGSQVAGGISAALLLADEVPPEGLTRDARGRLVPPAFLVSADYARDGGWTFEGALFPDSTVELVALTTRFLQKPLPDGLPSLTVDRMRVRVSTDGTFAFAGRITGRWTPTLLGGIPLSLRAEAELERRRRTAPRAGESEMVLVGTLFGAFGVGRFEVGAGITLTEREPTYLFRIRWDEVWVQGTTAWRGEGTARRQVVTFQLGGVTLGGLVEALVRLARPGAAFRLEAPWNALHSIDLSRFTLTVDPGERAVEVVFRTDLDLSFATLRSVGVRYQRTAGGDDGVRLLVEGRFLGTDRALAWDAVDEAPPAVPGKTKVLQVAYLGMGRHVALQGTHTSVASALAALKAGLRPVDPEKSPLDAPGVRYDPASQWLLGIDVTVMETVSLGIVLNDPALYGLVVQLAGARAGSLAGLRFELLYRRVTDDVGVFRVELRVPDAFRQLDVGPLSFTLGIVAVDVYTNGDFRVDLGFPWNRDFSRSFAVQYWFLVGQGGLYFGKLSGATSSRVPAIRNGTFSPVLELGIGLAVGVGRIFNKGPLRAQLTLQVVVIFEGVLAWFNPADRSRAPALYWKVQGTAGLVGTVSGQVDFTVVKVGVFVQASAFVSVTMEAYRSVTFTLRAGVVARATITVLWWDVHFSYSLQIEESFTVGADATPPWTLGTPPAATFALHAPGRSSSSRDAGLPETAAYALAPTGTRCAAAAGGLDWRPVPVFPDGNPVEVPLTLVPAFTVAGVPVQWNGTTDAGPAADPAYRLVFLVMAGNGIPAGARTIEDTHVQPTESGAGADVASLALPRIVEALLRWSLAAKGIAGDAPRAAIQELVREMADAATVETGFSWTNLTGFLEKNLRFALSGIPAGGAPARVSGTPFPIPPVLRWTSDQVPARDFAAFRPVGATYTRALAERFRKLEIDPAAGGAGGRPPRAERDAAESEPMESMATFVFRDAFLLMARTAVQAAADLLAEYPLRAGADDSLRTLAARFPRTAVEHVVRAGDTVAGVAALFGVSADALLSLNPGLPAALASDPGTPVTVSLGVTADGVARGNRDRPLRAGTRLPVGVVHHEVALVTGEPGNPTQSLADVAARYGLANAAALLAPLPPGAAAPA